jgi:site-specific DNA-cytosine methylase
VIRLADGSTDRVAVELGAGLGGIGIGLRALGFQIAKADDSWKEAAAIYNHNFPGEVAVTCNLLSEKGRQSVGS